MSSLTPKPKLVGQCKLCKLLKVYPDLWEEAHRRVMRERETHASVCRWLNSKLELYNAGLPKDEVVIEKVNAINMCKHFSKHMSERDKMKLALQSKVLGNNANDLTGNVNFTENEKYVAETFLNSCATEVSDYTYVSRLVETLETRLNSYNDFIKKQEIAEPTRRPNLTEITNFQDAVVKLMGLKLDLSRLRNSSAVAGLALRSGLEYSTAAFIDKLISVTEEALVVLKAEMPTSSLADETITFIRGTVASAMKALVPELLKKVSKEYNIK
jgi:hypothetical protein